MIPMGNSNRTMSLSRGAKLIDIAPRHAVTAQAKADRLPEIIARHFRSVGCPGSGVGLVLIVQATNKRVRGQLVQWEPADICMVISQPLLPTCYTSEILAFINGIILPGRWQHHDTHTIEIQLRIECSVSALSKTRSENEQMFRIYTPG